MRQASAPMRRVESLLVVWERRRGRPRRTWEEQLRLDLKALNLFKTMTVDRGSWRRQIRVVDSFVGSDAVVESLRGAVRRVNLSSVRATFIENAVAKVPLVSDGAENAVVALKNKKKKPVETHFFNDENEAINQIHVKPVYVPGGLPRPCLKCSKEHDLDSHPCYKDRTHYLKYENSNQVPVDGLQKGQSLPCRECSGQHPRDSYCPCDVCYRPHPSGVCPYFRCVPQGAAFSPKYYIVCQCGNLFDKDKWVCTFCGGGEAMLKPKGCLICNSYMNHNNYECPKDPAEAALYKSIRDAAIRRGPSVRIPYEEVCRSRISHAG